MPTTPASYANPVSNLVRKAAKQAPFAYQTKAMPSTAAQAGRFGGLPKASGGGMQGGGKRRPGSRTVKGL